MNHEEFEAAVGEAIRNNVTAETCGCGCNQTIIDGIEDAAKEIANKIAERPLT